MVTYDKKGQELAGRIGDTLSQLSALRDDHIRNSDRRDRIIDDELVEFVAGEHAAMNDALRLFAELAGYAWELACHLTLRHEKQDLLSLLRAGIKLPPYALSLISAQEVCGDWPLILQDGVEHTARELSRTLRQYRAW